LFAACLLSKPVRITSAALFFEIGKPCSQERNAINSSPFALCSSTATVSQYVKREKQRILSA
jgi:hypothetical protein